MASAWPDFDRRPMGCDATNLATKIAQGAITPNVALRVLRMALDREAAELVVGPDAADAPA